MSARIAVLLLVLAGLGVGVGQAGMFRNSEQAALEQFRAGDYEAAAEGFTDPYRRGVALYRAEQFRAAEVAFAEVERAAVRIPARYDLGNARFRQGDYAGAIEAYEQVLAEQPDHADAHYNLTDRKSVV